MIELVRDLAVNLFSAVVIAFLALVLVVAFARKVRRDKRRFFGLTDSNDVIIALSCYRPKTEPVTTDDGSRSVGYQDDTVAVDELTAALALDKLFNSSEVSVTIKSFVRALVTGSRTFEPIRPSLRTFKDKAIPQVGCLIILGTGAHSSNELAAYFLGEHEKSVFSYEKIEGRRLFHRRAGNGKAELKLAVTDHPKHSLAVVQRITVRHGPVVFLCSGADNHGTMRAAEYLAANWSNLYAKHWRFGGDFAQVMAFDRESGQASELG